MKRVIVLFTALCVVNFSAQEKMEKEQPIDKSQVTTKEAISLLENKSIQESAEIKKVVSHSLTSRHFQFFVKNIPIKEQADKV